MRFRAIAGKTLFCLALVCGSRAWPQTASPPPKSVAAIAKRAAEAADSDHLEEAARLYREALRIEPRWAEGWWSLGTLEYDRSHYAQAAQAFGRVMSLRPANGTARAMRGLCEFELGQDTLALKHIQEGKSLGVSSNAELDQVILFHEGVLQRRKAQFEAAQLTLGRLCRNGLQEIAVATQMGLVMLRIAEPSAPAENPPGAELVRRVGHAECLATQKKFDQARKEYASAAEEFPAYPNVHYAVGMFLTEAGDSAAAIEEFKREIAHHPNDLTSRLKIVSVLYKQDSRGALPFALEAVRMHPESPFAHYLLGLVYLDVDEYQKAIPELEMARKAFPGDAKVFFALGSAYSRAGRQEEAAEARRMFQKLSAREP